MSDDNKQDPSQSEGQSGIDRETEARNRENETGQAQDEQFGQKSGKDTTGEAGQPEGSDTTLSERTGQTGGASSSGFVGSGNDSSSDYVTKGEHDQDFAAQEQGAQDTQAGKSDIETGQSQDRDSDFDEGSDSNN